MDAKLRRIPRHSWRRDANNSSINNNIITLISIFILSSSLCVVNVASLCPNQCKCNEPNLKTTCSASSLSTIPITLNPRLKELYLNENKIRSLSASTLTFYSHLEILSLSSNKIASLDNKIILSKKLSSSSSSSTINNNNLHRLDARNDDNDLDDDNHHHHRLDANSINFMDAHKAPPTSLFHALNHLQILFLDNNLIETLNGNATFIGLDNLIILNLSFNKLTTIHARTFLGLDKLEELDLSNNLISFIDNQEDAFKGMPNLKVLSLRSNLLASFLSDAQLMYVSLSLQRLDYGDNRLDNVDGVSLNDVTSLDALQDLKLDKTNIKSFNGPTDAEDFPNLLSLDLSSNSISYLNQDQNVHLFQRLKCLNLKDNPFHCNCSFGWIKTLVFNVSVSRKNQTPTLDGDKIRNVYQSFDCDPSFDQILNIVCASPSKIKNQTLLSVDFDDANSCTDADIGVLASEESYICVWLLLLLLSSVMTLILIYLKLIIFKPKYPKFCDPFTTLNYDNYDSVSNFNTQLQYVPSAEWHLDYYHPFETPNQTPISRRTPNLSRTPTPKDRIISKDADAQHLIRITDNVYHSASMSASSSASTNTTQSSNIDGVSKDSSSSNGSVSNCSDVPIKILPSKPPPLPSTPRPNQRLMNHPMALNRVSSYGSNGKLIVSKKKNDSEENQMFAVAIKPNVIINQITSNQELCYLASSTPSDNSSNFRGSSINGYKHNNNYRDLLV